MTIGNAMLFIKRAMSEPMLRRHLNHASDSNELSRILNEESLRFSFLEFEQAFSLRLANSQEAEEAVQLREFRMWWVVLNRMPGCNC